MLPNDFPLLTCVFCTNPEDFGTVCGKSFTSVSVYEEHLCSEHLFINVFSCKSSRCKYQCVTIFEMLKHLQQCKHKDSGVVFNEGIMENNIAVSSLSLCDQATTASIHMAIAAAFNAGKKFSYVTEEGHKLNSGSCVLPEPKKEIDAASLDKVNCIENILLRSASNSITSNEEGQTIDKYVRSDEG